MDNQEQVRQITLATNSLTEVMARLGFLIDEETAALEINNIEKLELYSEQKNRILLEFNRALVAAGNVSCFPDLFKEVEQLRARLVKNRAMLKRQLIAVKEYSTFLEDETRRHETDGTYSQSIGS